MVLYRSLRPRTITNFLSKTLTPVIRRTTSPPSLSGLRLIASALMPSLTAGAACWAASSPASVFGAETTWVSLTISCNSTGETTRAKSAVTVFPSLTGRLSTWTGLYPISAARTEYIPAGSGGVR